ncbi:hypothetical protein CAGA_08220 [Caproiciproducens galactitolivorans]|uniref:Uncharacterized protein n=1 Tax=Caproiciproducens galactitolivorans TaxID=642589 RepID=A0A4Z0YKZ1_9FIRM|nr:hypothetical protein CAGA_08220 [Caproiciproducens galactitolivorans]
MSAVIVIWRSLSFSMLMANLRGDDHQLRIKRKKIIILCISLILAIVTAAWAWFTEPVTVDRAMQDRKVTNAVISYKTITKDGIAATTIQTQNVTEIKKVINLMNQYPYSRRLFATSPSNSSHYSDTHMIWISLGYKNGNGKPGIYNYLIYEYGYMQTSDSGEHLHPSGIGRFGTEKTKAFYSKITDLFHQLEGNSTWERTIDAS